MRKFVPLFFVIAFLALAALGFGQDKRPKWEKKTSKSVRTFLHKGVAYSKRESKGFNHAMKRDSKRVNEQATPRPVLHRHEAAARRHAMAAYHRHHRHHRRHHRHHRHHKS